MSFVVAAALAASCGFARAAVIAQWTFETSAPTTAGPFAAEVGVGLALGSHASASVYTSPAGNGTSHSFSYQFAVSTSGLSGIQLSFDQTSSNTGPAHFQLSYSTNGTSFTSIGTPYTVLANAAPNTTWNPTTSNPVYTFTPDLSAISALSDQATLYFRLSDTDTVSANNGTVAAGGTSRVDNVIVSGTAIPEASAMGLLAPAGLLLGRRRRA
jgi:hypothetical protein